MINTKKMNFLKSVITEGDTWNVSDGVYDGDLFIMRYRPHLQNFIETGKYNKRFVVIWKFESNNSILPNEEERRVMEEIEAQLVEIFETDLHTILAFVYTSKNSKEWHWYSKNIGDTVGRFNTILSSFDVLPINLFSENDPEWVEYKSVLSGGDDAIVQ